MTGLDVGKKASLALQEARHTCSIVSTEVRLTGDLTGDLTEDLSREIVKGIPLDVLPFTNTIGTVESLGPWHWNIYFDGPVPVGGFADLIIHSDGSYKFSGHFHDSGAPSYNVVIAWVVKSSSGTGFLFSSKGHLNGTFEAGSRDHDWNNTGFNQAIKNEWNALKSGWAYNAKAGANIDLGPIIGDVIKALEIVGQVISVVA